MAHSNNVGALSAPVGEPEPDRRIIRSSYNDAPANLPELRGKIRDKIAFGHQK
jgi:hypothetical protein